MLRKCIIVAFFFLTTSNLRASSAQKEALRETLDQAGAVQESLHRTETDRLKATESLIQLGEAVKKLEQDKATLEVKIERDYIEQISLAEEQIFDARNQLTAARDEVRELTESLEQIRAKKLRLYSKLEDQIAQMSVVTDPILKSKYNASIRNSEQQVLTAETSFWSIKKKLQSAQLKVKWSEKAVEAAQRIMAHLEEIDPPLMAQLQKQAKLESEARLSAEMQRRGTTEERRLDQAHAQYVREDQRMRGQFADYADASRELNERIELLGRQLTQTDNAVIQKRALIEEAEVTIDATTNQAEELAALKGVLEEEIENLETEISIAEEEAEIRAAEEAVKKAEQEAIRQALADEKERKQIALREAREFRRSLREKARAEAQAAREDARQLAAYERGVLKRWRIARKSIDKEKKHLAQAEKAASRYRGIDQITGEELASAQADLEFHKQQLQTADESTDRTYIELMVDGAKQRVEAQEIVYQESQGELEKINRDLATARKVLADVHLEVEDLEIEATGIIEERWQLSEDAKWSMRVGTGFRFLDDVKFSKSSLRNSGSANTGTFVFGPGGPGNNNVVNGPYGVQNIQTTINDLVQDPRFEGQTFSDDGDFSTDIVIPLDTTIDFNGSSDNWTGGDGVGTVFGLDRVLSSRDGWTLSVVGNLQYLGPTLTRTHRGRMTGNSRFTTEQTLHTFVDVEDIPNDNIFIGVPNPSSGVNPVTADNTQFSIENNFDLDLFVLDFGLRSSYGNRRLKVNLAAGPSINFSRVKSRQILRASWDEISSNIPPPFATPPVVIPAGTYREDLDDSSSSVVMGGYVSAGWSVEFIPGFGVAGDFRYDFLDDILDTDLAEVELDDFSLQLSVFVKF